MCELFALSADHSVEITGWLRTFFSHSDRHPHGFGLALFPPFDLQSGTVRVSADASGADAGRIRASAGASGASAGRIRASADADGADAGAVRVSADVRPGLRLPAPGRAAADDMPVILKGPEKASESSALQARLDEGVTARCAIAHIRRATVGNIEPANCHPFCVRSMSGRCGTLAHNGTIFSYPPLSIYYQKQLGETDSERILLRLMDLLLQKERGLGREATDEERFLLWEDEFARMAPKNKLNVLFCYAGTLYVHTNCEGTLCMREGCGSCAFATVPLDGSGWKPAPMMRLLAFRDGHPVACGRCHGHSYVENKEDLKYLYLAYSGL